MPDQNNPPNPIIVEEITHSEIPVTEPVPQKKNSKGKIIAGVLGLLLLVGGVATGAILVKQNQDISEHAQEATNCTPVCKPDHLDEQEYCDENGYWCQKIIGDWGINKNNCCTPIGGEESVCGLTNGVCDKYTYEAIFDDGAWCLDTHSQNYCDAGVRCSQFPDPRCLSTPPPGATSTPTPIATPTHSPTPPPGATSTPTPTPTRTPTPTPAASPTPGLTPTCSAIKAYDATWQLLSNAELSLLKAGDKVRFVVSGTPANLIDKGRFTINGVLKPEVGPNTTEIEGYMYEYIIPASVTTFTIKAELHLIGGVWF